MKKREMTKLQRKRLERELIRNRRQRRENRRDINRLESEFPAASVLQRRRKPYISFDDEEDMPSSRLRGEAVRGVMA